MSQIGKWTIGKLRRFVCITVTGWDTNCNIPSGSLAGLGSYIGLNTNNQFVLTSSAGGSGGDITGVTAGDGLSGGGTGPGDVTLDVDYAGADSVIRAAADGTGITVATDDQLLVSDTDDGNTVKYVDITQLSGALNTGYWSRVENYSGAKDAVYLTTATDYVGIGEDEPSSSLTVRGNVSVGSSYKNTAAPSNGMIVQGKVGFGTSSIISPYEFVLVGESLFTATVNVTGGLRIYDNASTNIISDTTDGTRLKTRTTLGGSTVAPTDTRVFIQDLKEDEYVRLESEAKGDPVRLEYSGSADDDAQIKAHTELSASTDAANSEMVHNVSSSAGGEKTGLSISVGSGEVTFPQGVKGSSPLLVLDGLHITTGSLSGSTAFLTDTLNVSGTITTAGDLHVNGGNIYGPTDASINLYSDESVYIRLDADNDASNASFSVYKSTGSTIFSVFENGSTNIYGDISNYNAATWDFKTYGDMAFQVDTDGSTAGSTNTWSFISGSTTYVKLDTTGQISGSGALTAVGATELKSTLAVSGTITAAGIASGSIAGPGSYVGLNASNQLVLTASAGGGGSPGGSNTQIQYNDAGSFGGDADFTWNKTANSLAVAGTISGSGALTALGATELKSTLAVSGSVTLGGVSAGTDNTVLVLNSSNQVVSDEIDSKVWEGKVVDYDGTPAVGEVLYYHDAGGTVASNANLTFNGTVVSVGAQLTASQGMLVKDDKKLYFGDSKEASIEYNEDGNNRLIISGSASGIELTGSIFTAGIASGTIAGDGSYVGLNSSNQLVLTASAGGGGGAPTDAQYVVLAADGDLSAERVLVAGKNTSITDNTTSVVVASRDTFVLATVPLYMNVTTTSKVFYRRGSYQYIGYVSYSATGDIPEPGNTIDFGGSYDNDYWFTNASYFVIPEDCTLVSASYSSYNGSANTSCTHMRNAIMKMASGSYGSHGGVDRNTAQEWMTMYYDDMAASTGDMRYKIYQRTFACTGSAVHLTCSAGDIVTWMWEPFGASAGINYWYGSLVFALSGSSA